MKLFNSSLLLLATLLLVSCDYESFEEETALGNLEFGNRFIRILTGGADGEAEVEISEDGAGTTEVAIQNLFTSGGDVTVEYALGGTAEFGEDYTIEGASAEGGSLFIPFDNADIEDTSPAEADIVIEYFIDTLVDGPETIIIELLSATNSENTPLDVGQGPLRKTLTLNLVND